MGPDVFADVDVVATEGHPTFPFHSFDYKPLGKPMPAAMNAFVPCCARRTHDLLHFKANKPLDESFLVGPLKEFPKTKCPNEGSNNAKSRYPEEITFALCDPTRYSVTPAARGAGEKLQSCDIVTVLSDVSHV